MRKRTAMVILGSVFLTSLSFSSTFFTGLGWSVAILEVNGFERTYVNGADPLPPDVVTDIIDGNATHFSLSKSQNIRGNQAGTAKSTIDGHFYYRYKIKTTATFDPADDMFLTGTSVSYSNATAWSSFTGFSAAGRGVTGKEAKSYAAQQNSNSMILEDPQTSSDRKAQVFVGQVSWQSVGSGMYEATVTAISPDLSASAKVVGVAGNGNMTGALATGNGSYKFYPTGIIAGPGKITFVTNAKSDELLVNVYTDSDMHLNDWSLNMQPNGEAYMTFADYKAGSYILRIRTGSTLWTPVSFTYGETAATINVNLSFGDLDGDNYISAEEVAYVQSCIGKKKSDGYDWHCGDGVPYGPVDCDFNGDGQITQADYDLCSGNVGMHGH